MASLIYAEITVEDIPVWKWPWAVPRNLFRRYRWIRDSSSNSRFWGLVVAIYLGTKQIRIGKVDV